MKRIPIDFCTVLGILFGIVALSMSVTAEEQSKPTFYRDVLPILQEHCQNCHRPAGTNLMGMVAPMSLLNYAEVRPWAKAIARQVSEGTMPPWHASREHDGVFKNQRTLTDAEIHTLTRWSGQGALRGNPKDAPSLPHFPDADAWSIGEPDLVLGFDEPVFVRDEWKDQYVNVFVEIPEDKMPGDRWIQAMEIRPGSEAVHHVVIFTDDYRESMGAFRGMLGGVGPGTDPTVFPEGYGRHLSKGTGLMFSMHYHKEPGPGTGLYDRTEIAFRFHDKPVHHEVNWGAVSTFNFSIPPYDPNYAVRATQRFDTDTTLFALFPHTHLRGKAARYRAFYPDGTEEILLDVPKYDFNWQTNYIYRTPKHLPAGTRVEVTMWYDNSEERAELTGIDPSRHVYFGEPTTDEMMFGWMDYTTSRDAVKSTD